MIRCHDCNSTACPIREGSQGDVASVGIENDVAGQLRDGGGDQCLNGGGKAAFFRLLAPLPSGGDDVLVAAYRDEVFFGCRRFLTGRFLDAQEVARTVTDKFAGEKIAAVGFDVVTS